MPQYEYRCQRCGKTQTKQYAVQDRPQATPCSCGGKAHYQMSAPNVRMTESINPIDSQINSMDMHHEDETPEDRAMEKDIPNVDSEDLYKND